MTATYHTDDYRLRFVFSMNKTIFVIGEYFDYDVQKSYSLSFSEDVKDGFVLSYFYDISGEETATSDKGVKIVDTALAKLSEFNPTFDTLIKDKTGLDYPLYESLAPDYIAGSKKITQLSLLSLFFLVMGIIGLAANIFFLAFCFIYGRKKGVSPFEATKVDPEALSRSPQAKKDFFFGPFVPETLFELVGIFFVFFGSLRILYYFFTIMGFIAVSGNEFTEIPNALFYLFMIGMFLLYFIDFDIFLDDKRVFRNVVLDFLIFVVLYIVESLFLTGLRNSDSLILSEFSAKLTIPNNFGTITCYFLMMLTLFYTPKANKKPQNSRFLSASHHHHRQHPDLSLRQHGLGLESLNPGSPYFLQ